jgi:hypothetical protein
MTLYSFPVRPLGSVSIIPENGAGQRVLAAVAAVAQDLRQGDTIGDIANIATLRDTANYTAPGTVQSPEIRVNGTAQADGFTLSDGDSVVLYVADDAGSAPYVFAIDPVVVQVAPSFSAQPTITGIPNIGQTLTLTEGVAGPGATLAITRFTLDGVDKTDNLSGLTWNTMGESIYGGAGLVELAVTASNSGGVVVSDTITETMQDVPEAYSVSNWSVSAGSDDAFAVTVSTSPDDGNSTVTDTEYRINNGPAVSGGVIGSLTGSTGAAGTFSIQIRNVNAIGAGGWSDSKSVTTGSPTAAPTYTVSVPSGAVSADLTGFPLKIDLGNAPAAFWGAVARSDGGDIRVTSNSDVGLPFHLIDIDTVAQTGTLVTSVDLLTASDNTFKVVANNDAAMLPLAATDPLGQHASWASFDAVYLLNGDLTDATGNGRTLTWSGAGPTYVSESLGCGGGFDTTAAAGYGYRPNDPAFHDQPFEMFTIARRTVENSSNQIALGVVTSLGSNSSRVLLGEQNGSGSFELFSTSHGFNSAGVSSALGQTASLAFASQQENAGVFDSVAYANGSQFWSNANPTLSEDTLLVGTGRGSSNTDWRGVVNIALFALTDLRGAAWHDALHKNFVEDSLIGSIVVQNVVVGLA